MTIFNLFSLLGGLAMFLYGMSVMGDGLEKLAGGKLERILEKLTSNKLIAVLLGAGVTAVIQSSSATTVMVVGFVNSGIMKLSQSIGVMMGANIGTTVTAWILSLSGVQGDSLLMNIVKPENFTPVLALIGIILLMMSKSDKKQSTGHILIGFAVLMFGMDTMSGAVSGLKDSPSFANILVMFSNPVLGLLVGAVLTAIIQSSSASVGILQALSATGQISFATAVPILMGQNIGTCITALISCIGTSKNAKRAAVANLYIKIISAVMFLAVFYALNAVIGFAFINSPISSFNIAVIHTLFNVASTIILLPFTKVIEKLVRLTIREGAERNDFAVLDERFLQTPAFAVEQCKHLTDKMAALAGEGLELALSAIRKYDADVNAEVRRIENEIDEYEDHLGTYLVRLSAKNLAKKDSRMVSLLLHSITNFERISDHSVNLVESAEEIHDKNITFTPKAYHEIDILRNAISEIVTTAIESFSEDDIEKAAKIEPLEEVVDNICAELRNRHVDRLQAGECTILGGFVFNDLLTNLERVSDHCSNIGATLIQAARKNFDTHDYLSHVKQSDTEFDKRYAEYARKYMLP